MSPNEFEQHEKGEAGEVLNLQESVTNLENLVLLAKSGGLNRVKEVFEKAKKS